MAPRARFEQATADVHHCPSIGSFLPISHPENRHCPSTFA
jgi:hypothetical protein